MEWIETIFLVLAYVAILGFLISGLDDLFFDSHFLLYLLRHRKKPRVTLDQLKLVPEQWIAIFVPAWQEGGVVNKMAEYAARILLYEKYDLFIGIYPNDAETIACVDQICAHNPRIHKVVVPHPGPTNKADCLNWIYRAMRLNEIPGVREYKIVAIHDAEDVLHPLVLKVYNFFVPRVYDMAQLPVFALEHPVWKYWSANTYVDDFSELHTKDLFVRESIGGVVPSAGVGTCFSRSVLYRLAARSDGDPFRIGNLTEDYEIGIRIKRAGYRTGIIAYPVDRIVRKKRRDGSLGPPVTVTDVVAVRENFPTTFWTAVRQRTRWILGISFQTWEQAGWSGSWPVVYTLLRDRRAPLTHLINMTGYLTLFYVLVQWLFGYSPWAGHLYIRPLFTPDAVLWKLVIVDTWMLAYRAAQKFISVRDVYNLKQAVFSIPRVVIGNLINFVATIRACYLFAASKLFNRPLVWHKTSHVFPDTEELTEYSKSIEDLLVEQGLVTREQIFEAMKMDEPGSAPLCLLRMGLIEESQFTSVWAGHSSLPVRFLDPDRVPRELLEKFSETQSLQLHAVPVEQTEQETVLAFREPPKAARIKELANQLGRPVRPVLARPSSIAFCRNRAYPRLVMPPSKLSTFAARFQQAAGLDMAAFLELSSLQHTSGRSLPDVLVDRGLLTAVHARQLWAEGIGCPPSDLADIQLDSHFYNLAGPTFWWLHRLIPVRGKILLTSVPQHPLLLDWLAQRLGATLAVRAELPSRLELVMRDLGLEIDPDAALVTCLAGRGVLKSEEVPNIEAMRTLITDPVPHWLLMQKLATEAELHQAFLDICCLPAASPWLLQDVRRLLPILPPRVPAENKCYPLGDQSGLRIGLGQVPTAASLNEIYNRLAGYPIVFQALSFADSQALRRMV